MQNEANSVVETAVVEEIVMETETLPPLAEAIEDAVIPIQYADGSTRMVKQSELPLIMLDNLKEQFKLGRIAGFFCIAIMPSNASEHDPFGDVLIYTHEPELTLERYNEFQTEQQAMAESEMMQDPSALIDSAVASGAMSPEDAEKLKRIMEDANPLIAETNAELACENDCPDCDCKPS